MQAWEALFVVDIKLGSQSFLIYLGLILADERQGRVYPVSGIRKEKSTKTTGTGPARARAKPRRHC